MALDADAEPLTRDDIDGIIAHGDPVERMFLLRRHDLTRRQRRMLVRDPDIRVRERFICRTDLTRREQIKLVLTTPMVFWSVISHEGY